MQDCWQEELAANLKLYDEIVPRPNLMRKSVASMLNSKGYKTKLTSKFDVIISMKEEEYVYLKLKYS